MSVTGEKKLLLGKVFKDNWRLKEKQVLKCS